MVEYERKGCREEYMVFEGIFRGGYEGRVCRGGRRSFRLELNWVNSYDKLSWIYFWKVLNVIMRRRDLGRELLNLFNFFLFFFAVLKY